MGSGAVSDGPVYRQHWLWWFIGIELVAMAAFVVLQLHRREALSYAVLVGGFQLFAWVVVSRRDYGLLVLFSLLLPLTGLELLPPVYYHWVLYPGTLLLIVAFRTGLRLRRGESLSTGVPRTFKVPLVGFGIAVAIAAIHARGAGMVLSDGSLRFYTVLALESVAFAWLFAVVPESLRDVRRVLLILGTVFALSSLLLPYFVVTGEAGLGSKTLVSPSGAYVNLNALAVPAAVFIPVLLGLVVDSRRLGHRLALAALLLLCVVALVFTRSRGAWLGCGAAFLYMVFRIRSYKLVIVTAVGLAVLLSVDVFRASVFSRLTATSLYDPSLSGRLVLWFYAVKVIRANWLLGVGMENFRYVKHAFGFPASVASALRYNSHNLYLEILADTGVVGFASFLWLKVGSILRLDRTARRQSLSEAGMAFGLAGGIVAYAVHGLWDALTWSHGAFVLLGVLIGLATSVHRLSAAQCRPVSEVVS